MKNKIYLDNAASTPILPEVRKVAIEMLDIYGNPSSIHSVGLEAKEKIANAANDISKILNCKASELNFTTGATMSNNLAIQGFLKANPNGKILYSAIEHDDIILMAKNNNSFEKICVGKNGKINLNELKTKLLQYKDMPVLVSVQSANSEIGVIQDIKHIANIVHSFANSYFHTDATQYLPYYQMDLSYIDMMSMSGQKIGCIKGTGLLYIKEGTPVSSIIYGEQGFIGGTENTLGICCLAEAFKNLQYEHKHCNMLLQQYRLISELTGTLVGSVDRLPNNICLHINKNAVQFVYLLDEYGIQVSSGSACSNLNDQPSHVILALGYDEEYANNCIRITLSSLTTDEEIDYTIKTINKLLRMVL